MNSLANIIIRVWELLADEEFELLLSFTEGKDASRVLGSISFKKLMWIMASARSGQQKMLHILQPSCGPWLHHQYHQQLTNCFWKHWKTTTLASSIDIV
jgi:hypothetical protein